MFLKYSLLKLQPTHKPENSSKNLLGEKSGDSGARMVRSESPLLPQEYIGGKKNTHTHTHTHTHNPYKQTKVVDKTEFLRLSCET